MMRRHHNNNGGPNHQLINLEEEEEDRRGPDLDEEPPQNNDIDQDFNRHHHHLPSSSSVLSYLQRRPNRHHHHPQDDLLPDQSSAQNRNKPPPPTQTTPRYYSIRRPGARYGKGLASIKAQGRALAFKTKSTLLLRMLGSTLGTSFKFSILVFLLIPLSVTIFPYGGDAASPLGLIYAQAAVSCVGQFLLLTLSLLTLIHHVYCFQPNRTFLQNELKKPISILTVLIAARVFSAFTACILTAAGLPVTVQDISASAVIGIIAILDDIARRRFYFNWTHQINKSNQYSTTRPLTRLMAITLTGLLGSISIQKLTSLWYANRQRSISRLILTLLFSPFPFPGQVTESRNSSAVESTVKIVLIGFTSYWIALWITKVRLDYNQAAAARTLEMDSELLLSLSGRSFTGQFALWSHLISLMADFPTRPITSSRTAFLESELSNRGGGMVANSATHSIAQQQRDYIFLPKQTLEEVRREQGTTIKNYSGGNKKHHQSGGASMRMLPYRFVANLVQRIFRRKNEGGVTWWLNAAALCLCQQVAHWPARLVLFALQPDLFLGIPPFELEKCQLEVLSGRKRSTFFSPFGLEPHMTILSGEATKLLFGGRQTILAILRRQIALIKALQYILFVTETVTVTPPTGSFIRSVVQETAEKNLVEPTNSKPGGGGKRHESIFRYNPGIESAADSGVGLLLGSDLTLMSHTMTRWSFFIPLINSSDATNPTRSKWLKFDDGTVGLLCSARSELLELCREALSFNLNLALMSLEGTLCLMRAHEAFFPSAVSTNEGITIRDEQRTQLELNKVAGLRWETREKLKQHFPSFNQMIAEGLYSTEIDRTSSTAGGGGGGGSVDPHEEGGGGCCSSTIAAGENSSVYVLCQELLSLVAHSCTATGQFAAIPNCAPYATRHPVLASAADGLSKCKQ